MSRKALNLLLASTYTGSGTGETIESNNEKIDDNFVELYAADAALDERVLVTEAAVIKPYQITTPEQLEPLATNVEIFQELAIPHADLVAGSRWRVRAWGTVTGVNGAPKITGRLRFGNVTGVIIAATGANTATIGLNIRLEAELWIEAEGGITVAKWHSAGRAKVTGVNETETFVKDDVSVSTTVDAKFRFSQEWDGDDASNRFKLYELSFERIPAAA